MNTIEMERITGDFGFEVKDENGHILHTDSSIENGGSNYGFRPMQLVLSALGSCSAIDMVSVLKKQRQTVEQFKIKIEGEREKDTIPSLWKSIKVSFELYGNIDKEKANKAGALSIEKYCSVAETLRRGGTQITWQVNVINSESLIAR
ncbi:MAG: OsmC family protein [Ginsengibacter sp.]